MSDEPVILEMFGDPDAAQCIDGVCTVPGAVGDGSSDADEAPDVEGEVTQAIS